MLTRKEYVNQAHVGEITITVVLGARHLDSRSIIQAKDNGSTMKKRKSSMFYANLQHNNWPLPLFMAPISVVHNKFPFFIQLKFKALWNCVLM